MKKREFQKKAAAALLGKLADVCLLYQSSHPRFRELQVLQNLLLRSEKRIKHENEAAAGKYSVAARSIL